MTKQINRMIEKGKPVSAVSKLVKIEFEKQDKEIWNKQKGREYDSIFYTQEVPVEAVLDEDGNILEEATIEYEYITDCPAFDEWLNEKNILVEYAPAVYTEDTFNVVSEAVQATYDEEGNILTPYEPAVTEGERPVLVTAEVAEVSEPIHVYVPNDVTTLVDTYPGLVEYKAKLAKNTIDSTLAKLTVTTSLGKTFDSNLESRQNMADGILAAETMGLTENIWRLADNSEVLVGIAELREAHALALQAYAATKSIGA